MSVFNGELRLAALNVSALILSKDRTMRVIVRMTMLKGLYPIPPKPTNAIRGPDFCLCSNSNNNVSRPTKLLFLDGNVESINIIVIG